MTALEVRRWDLREGGLTEAALRLKYLPAWRHRIAVQKYQPGVKFHGQTRAGELFILAGKCRVRWESHDPCLLERLDYLAFPPSKYSFEVLGSLPCKVARVWVLPFGPPAPSKNLA